MMISGYLSGDVVFDEQCAGGVGLQALLRGEDVVCRSK